MADVHLPPSLLVLFPGAPRKVRIDAATVSGLMAELDRRWPGMWDRLCTNGPTIRAHINVFVDGERAAITDQLVPSAVVRIIPALSGG